MRHAVSRLDTFCRAGNHNALAAPRRDDFRRQQLAYFRNPQDAAVAVIVGVLLR